MKKISLLFASILIFTSFIVSGQFTQLKKFDFNLLKNKVLYIENFSESTDFAKKYIKKLGTSNHLTTQDKISIYNKIWAEAMAKSSYDATPYEMREFDQKKLFKEKNQEAIVILYTTDKYGNNFAEMWITGPKRVSIANTVINGLNLWDVNDLCLMINMLNYSLNECAEIDATTKDKSRSALRSKYKENMVAFYKKLSDQVFYVVKEDGLDQVDKLIEKAEKDPEARKDPETRKYIDKYKKSPSEKKKELEKANEINKDVEEALKENWTICKYEMLSEEDLLKKKEEGINTGFYWKSFKYFTNNPFMTYKLKYLLTIDRDEVVFFYYGLGNAKFKGSTVKDLQDKIVSQGERFKKQLEKE